MTYPISIGKLVGQTFASVSQTADTITFTRTDGPSYLMFHDQDCCEFVYIEDVTGELEWLAGSPITQAEEISSEGADPKHESEESYTWTFYRIATAKGSVVIRWYGSSNGYYSESVNFAEV